ncbi:MAG TPA: hypothetical protein VMA77_08215 [Solirubrobacteraceae bacterium]|nr:hypothetical protein [Solirubrobacteraceae bacterium]
MRDPSGVEICAQCLAGAAAYEGDDDDLALAATALACDLAETQGDDAAMVLDLATREATKLLVELEGESFANSLRRLAAVRHRVSLRLSLR